ncbi:unnamed protein product [Fusarium graminearum]|uniref:Chromosome 4, complete genome n=1 Tax=Gibberella zeae (strain ATCC MYA-4620 / CBS 123657 / FGSC 9075 / NRRL 31084 / PH-1) TaxID=229533 RepID=A0A098DSW4_GIBZE|nr:unnamed protein product [Fusarium graminearum]CZS74657.1 unnamed protein product [Fusarium graminearum]
MCNLTLNPVSLGPEHGSRIWRGGGETRRSESFDDNIDINGYHRGTVGITVDADGVGHLELPPTWTDSALVEIVAPQTLLASFLRVSTTHEIE